jgi:hypothetical protein
MRNICLLDTEITDAKMNNNKSPRDNEMIVHMIKAVAPIRMNCEEDPVVKQDTK